MHEHDIKSFFADEENLLRDDYLFFTYSVETCVEPRVALAGLCSEMSTAQWSRPGKDEDFRPKFAAKVVHFEVLEISKTPHFVSAFHHAEAYTRLIVRIAYPHRNFGARIPNLLTVACGEGAFYSHGVSAIKLLDIDFPDEYLSAFSGPKFGLDGIRGLLEVYDRPIFCGVVKPNVGLKPEDFVSLAYEAWCGGLDIAKDDEMLADTEYSPLDLRTKLAGEACKKAEDETGTKKIFLANITDEVSELKRLHDIAVKNGAGAVMVNGFTTGLSAVRSLSAYAQVPVVSHFDFMAWFSRIPFFGVSSYVMTKLQRLCGFDLIIMPGFGSRMLSEEDEVLDNVETCLNTFGNLKRSLPAPGGSDSAVTLPTLFQKLGHADFAMVPGRGVFGHPAGPRAGALSLHQAWDAVQAKEPLHLYAKEHKELALSISTFSS